MLKKGVTIPLLTAHPHAPLCWSSRSCSTNSHSCNMHIAYYSFLFFSDPSLLLSQHPPASSAQEVEKHSCMHSYLCPPCLCLRPRVLLVFLCVYSPLQGCIQFTPVRVRFQRIGWTATAKNWILKGSELSPNACSVNVFAHIKAIG